SYTYAMPNKFFESMLAGVPILVGKDIVEMAHAVESHKLGLTMQQDDPEQIAEAMLELYRRRDEFAATAGQIAQRNQIFGWSAQENRLITLYAGILDRTAKEQQDMSFTLRRKKQSIEMATVSSGLTSAQTNLQDALNAFKRDTRTGDNEAVSASRSDLQKAVTQLAPYLSDARDVAGGAAKTEIAPAFANAAAAWRHLDNFDKAAEAMSAALTIDPSQAAWHAALGRSLARLERTEEAVAAYQRALDIRPDQTAWADNLAQLLSDHGREDEAVAVRRAAVAECCAALEKQPDDVSLMKKLAGLQITLGHGEDAIEVLHKARSLAPDNAAIHATMGSAYDSLERTDDALSAFHAAIAINPDKYSWLKTFARLQIEAGRDRDAIATYARLTSLRPRAVDVLVSYHDVLIREQAFDEAIEVIKQAAEIEPHKKHIQTRYDRALALESGFVDRLRQIDNGKARKRLFIAGCGRSGTWLLDRMMSCFDDIWQAENEYHYGHFARITSEKPVHLLKRSMSSHRDLHLLPAEIGLLYIIRHPFDVLTSTHIDRDHHISPERWTKEIAALKRIIDRPNSIVVRFEDLVTDANAVQTRIGVQWGLVARQPFTEFHKTAVTTEFVAQSMNGLRAPDPSVLGRYKKNRDHCGYCQSLTSELGTDLHWVADRFGYDLELNETFHPG
ncbi:MAG: tetratricopeptide repeat protein, partial [Hyphomicrobiaceae bacterium]